MKRSKLRNKYLCERKSNSKSLYNKQRNLCVSILRQTKREFFGSLKNKIFTDNGKLWKTVSPLFFEKSFRRECITLKKVIKQLQIMKNQLRRFIIFFSKIVPNLNIDNNLGGNIANPNVTDLVFCAIKKYENHPSNLKIKEMMGKKILSFSFKLIDGKKILNELQKLKNKKAFHGSGIKH